MNDSEPLNFLNETDAVAPANSLAPSEPNRAIVSSRRDRWSTALVHRALSHMVHGQLSLRAPDGTPRVFGGSGPGPTAEIRVRRNAFYRRCAAAGDVGFGEAYQAGDWDTPDLPAVIAWFCANVDSSTVLSGTLKRDWLMSGIRAGAWLANRIRHVMHRNSLRGSSANIQAHYDLGNEFYSLWLDPSMTYSAALFEAPDQGLASAQTAKYERLCRQLRLQPTDHLLEIGSGWGGLASHAARTRGCRITTVTISPEQHRFTTERLRREGFGDSVNVRLQDYRQLTGQFDKIVSIEMLEAVGDNFLPQYFRQVQSLLKRDGLFAAQFITCPDHRHAELRRNVDWIQKHIFPGSLLLSLNRVNQVIQATGRLSLYDLQDLGLDYAQTLRHWRQRFLAQLPAVRSLGFDDHFIRTWDYYLAYCESAFASRNISVIQGTWAGPNCRALMS